MLRAHSRRPLPTSTALVTALCAAAAALTGCSSGADKPKSADPAPAADRSVGQAASPTAETPLGISSDGVTTRMAVPAESTEEQYAQACLTASDWMSAKGGDRHSLVEPYLKEIQASAEAGRATFGKTWSALTDPQRAGVIIAVRAAAEGGC